MIIVAYNTKVKEVKGLSNNFPDYFFEFSARETLQEWFEKKKIDSAQVC